MSLSSKPTHETDDVDASFLSSNHKVMHYLHNSTRCSTNNFLNVLHKTSSHTNDLFTIKDIPMHNHHPHSNHQDTSQHRIRSRSENGSSASMIDTLARYDFSLGSSLSDPGGHCSILSSNTSSSGICSTFSDVGHEENTSTSSEELDFNLGFDQISDHEDDLEIANLDDIDDDEDGDDDYELLEGEDPRASNKNSAGGGEDTATLRDMSESNLDVRICELEDFLRKSYSSTHLDDNDDFNNDDTITVDPSKQQQRATFLHNSTYTLCPQDRFSAYAEDDDTDDHEQMMNGGAVMRSNSLGIVQLNGKSALLDKAPKKVVRFADMLGLDLESIRYMTPPDQSTTSLIQECIRIKLEQLRLAKSQSTASASPSSASSSVLPFNLPTSANRSPSSSSPAKSTHQYYLISKSFTSPTNIVPLIYERQVMLECLYTKDSTTYGTVRVHNCAYDKRVFARVTEDQWTSSYDIQAWHSMNYPDDNTDTFTFEIRLGKYNVDAQVPKQLYFAICLQAMYQEFWDNNLGWNYCLDLVERR